MLEHRPVLKERLLACAVFGAIAIGVVAASDVLVTGGFDLPSTERGAHADTPNFFKVAARDLSDSLAPQAHPRTWDEEFATDAEYTSYAADELAGAADSTNTQFSAYRRPTEEELRREIAEMYSALPSASDDAAYADDAYAQEPYDAEPVYAEAVPVSDGKDSSAYGSASPW
ncbi:hypothetical protein [Vitreimonas flagellata]|uniref:hypothetical protein n=1 Tax=Vitreimonas flagellata TaxID=2560861 RepID=UPI0010757773|nr:hypothetical protein [Vitreimonas flagellata]